MSRNTRTAVYQGELQVPLYQPAYTLSTDAFGQITQFLRGSLYPMLTNVQQGYVGMLQGSDPSLVGGSYFILFPFQYSRLFVSSQTGAGPTTHLPTWHGNLLVGATQTYGGFNPVIPISGNPTPFAQPGFYTILVPGANNTIPSIPATSQNTYWMYEPATTIVSGTNFFVWTDSHGNAQFGTSSVINDVSGNHIMAVNLWLPLLALESFGMSAIPDYCYSYTTGYGGILRPGLVANSPDFTAGENWSIFTDGGPQTQTYTLTQWNENAQNPTLLTPHFDDPILDGYFQNNPGNCDIQPNIFGWTVTIHSLPQPYKNQSQVCIYAKHDWSAWTFLRLMPQNAYATNILASGSLWSSKIDPQGIFYLGAAGLASTPANSAGLDLPFTTPISPPLPVLPLPCYSAPVNPLPAQRTNGSVL